MVDLKRFLIFVPNSSGGSNLVRRSLDTDPLSIAMQYRWFRKFLPEFSIKCNEGPSSHDGPELSK